MLKICSKIAFIFALITVAEIAKTIAGFLAIKTLKACKYSSIFY